MNDQMPKVLVCGRGGSGKSTLVTMLARTLGEGEAKEAKGRSFCFLGFYLHQR